MLEGKRITTLLVFKKKKPLKRKVVLSIKSCIPYVAMYTKHIRENVFCLFFKTQSYLEED